MLNRKEIAPEGGLATSPLDVLLVFLRLGLTSFGGPIAHIGYFREEFVRRRKWLDETEYADLVALCQFLPGPASSQVGFALGLRQAGAPGAIAAWIGFTLPSAVLMIAFAMGATLMTGDLAQGVIHGLKLVAVAVVAQAVWGMARTLTPDAQRIAVSIAAFVVVTFVHGDLGQPGAIFLGGAMGLLICRDGPEAPAPVPHALTAPKWTGLTALVIFLLLLGGLPALLSVTHNPILERFDAFYRSGALVFGGGHVILPLLKHSVVDPGWVDQDAFLAGYAAAQAMPGPLFTFAGFLGTVMHGQPTGLPGGLMALFGVFLPGMLTLVAVLPFWSEVQRRPSVRAAMRGANASVVGILAATLYNPIWTSSIHHPLDIALAGAGFALLTVLRAPPVAVVGLGAMAGVGRTALGF